MNQGCQLPKSLISHTMVLLESYKKTDLRPDALHVLILFNQCEALSEVPGTQQVLNKC